LPAVQQLIDEFPEIFQEPTELPPRRPCDHKIPLVLGAPPVAIRQYRYKPALKDEIEKQVSEMLQSGLVQPSSSSFSFFILGSISLQEGWDLEILRGLPNAQFSNSEE
jgi:hypothetical protein